MKVAIIGSRGLNLENIENYVPKETTEIVSGGAKGVDKCAEEYAKAHGIKLTVFLPDYRRYGRKGRAAQEKSSNNRSRRRGDRFLGRSVERNKVRYRTM